MKPEKPAPLKVMPPMPPRIPQEAGIHVVMTEEEALVALKLIDTVPATGREVMKRFISLGAKIEAAAKGGPNVR